MSRRSFGWTLVGLIAGFLLVNVGTFVAYQNKTYPRTTVGNDKVGSVAFADLPKKLSDLPTSLRVSAHGKDRRFSAKNLKLAVDTDKLAKSVKQQRSWLPVGNFFRTHQVPLTITYDQQGLGKLAARLSAIYKKGATSARIRVDNGVFRIAPDMPGYRSDTSIAKDTVVGAVEDGQNEVALPTTTIAPKTTSNDLQPTLKKLQTQQNTKVVLGYKTKTKTFTPAELSSWYQPANGVYVLSDANIRNSIISTGIGFGIGVKNIDQAVQAAHKALQTNKALSFLLKAAPLAKKSFTYCVAARGAPGSYLPGLSAKLASVYGDVRGWGLGGRVRLTEASSGCDFTVWLSVASQMPSFGSICDAMWSCRVGPNVVINFDRWRYASDAWNKSGGTLENYRVMVINHETGHWFGFGHANCGGAGQAAPVMQQQSISLQGCKFNPWPLASEQAALKSSLGI